VEEKPRCNIYLGAQLVTTTSHERWQEYECYAATSSPEPSESVQVLSAKSHTSESESGFYKLILILVAINVGIALICGVLALGSCISKKRAKASQATSSDGALLGGWFTPSASQGPALGDDIVLDLVINSPDEMQQKMREELERRGIHEGNFRAFTVNKDESWWQDSSGRTKSFQEEPDQYDHYPITAHVVYFKAISEEEMDEEP